MLTWLCARVCVCVCECVRVYVPLPSLVDPLFIAFVDSSAHSCCLLLAFALIPSVTKLVAMLRELDPKDKVREVTSEHLVNKLYAMGVISKTSKLSDCERLATSRFCARRLPVVMVRPIPERERRPPLIELATRAPFSESYAEQKL